jgi:two-component system phosphate regulon sensor histidine kinase PhoR
MVEAGMRFEAISGPMIGPRPLTRHLSALISRLEPLRAPLRTFRRRLRRDAWPLAAAATLFVLLHAVSGLPWLPAVAGFLVVASVIVGHDPVDGEGEDETAGVRAVRGPGGSDRETSSWRPLLDAIPDAVVALDQNLNVMHFNALFQELYPKVRPGHPLSHVSRNPELNDAVEKAAVGSEAVVVDIFERVPVERRISVTVSRLAGNQGRRGLPLLLISFRDLTEQDKLAQMRADFIANASHELRTPLASLRGFVETLQGPARDDPEARGRFLGIMSSQANRMTRLIDDLLSLSRVEMRVHLPPRGIVDLNEVSAYVAQALDPLAVASKMKIVVTKAEGPVRIRGDRDEIVQVMQNLVHNAIKYGREGGNVEIGVSRVLDGSPPHPRALVAVADDGPGIEPDHLPRLTERFYRANAAASREKGGTGLGLAIVKHIVIRHRGELRISSVVGKGSTFSLLFDELGTSRA